MEFLSQLQQDILRYLWQAPQATEAPTNAVVLLYRGYLAGVMIQRVSVAVAIGRPTAGDIPVARNPADPIHQIFNQS
ncbi:MAG TPA: hypothetical protein PKH77_05415 [Anaerolineae bacterium]|nr:hypothetical protein [Anaerolineae bacterium]